MNVDERTHIQELINRCNYRKRLLEERSAIMGPHIDPSVSYEIKQLTLKIAELEQQLAGLSPDENLASSLPPTSRMPLFQNSIFVGRDAELRELQHFFGNGESKVAGQGRLAAICGLGGVGKTQLASEFVHRHGYSFSSGVFWLNFSDANAVQAEVAACGGAGYMDLGLDFSTRPVDDQVRLVRAEWQRGLPRLLVFDQCEDEELLKEWLPTSGGARVLITTRRSSWDPELGVKVVALSVLTRAESIKLLRKHIEDPAADDAVLNTIAAELGNLPLALRLAGRYLNLYSSICSPAAYLKELRTKSLLTHPSLAHEDFTSSATSSKRHVGRTFALSYDRLDPNNSVDVLARALLERASYFSLNEPILHTTLLQTIEVSDQATRHRAVEAVKRLTNLGLLETVQGPAQDTALRIHRLVAGFVQNNITDQKARLAVQRVLSEVMCDVQVPLQRRRTAAFQLLRLDWLSDISAVASNELLILLDLVGRLVAAQDSRTKLAEAIGHKLDSQTTVSDHQRARLHVFQAALLAGLGKLDAAEQGYKNAELCLERIASVDYRLLAQVYLGAGGIAQLRATSLGKLEEEQGNHHLQRAVELLTEAVKAAQNDNHDVILEASCHGELSYTYVLLKQWDKAESAYSQARDVLDRSSAQVKDRQEYVNCYARVLETASDIHLKHGRALLVQQRWSQAQHEFKQAYALARDEIQMLQQFFGETEDSSLIFAWTNAGDAIWKLHRCRSYDRSLSMAEGYRYWQDALTLAQRMGIDDMERRIRRRCRWLVGAT